MQTEQKTLQASISKNADFSSADVNVNARSGKAYLDVTVQTGTSIDVVVEEKDATSGKYFVLATFTQVTGVAQEAKDVDKIDSGVIRARATIVSGGGAFTYSVGFSGKEGDQD